MRQACVTPTASALTLDTPSAHAAHPKKGGGGRHAKDGRTWLKLGRQDGGMQGGRETQAGVRLAGATPTASVQILDMPSAPAAHPARDGHTQAGSNRPCRTIVLAQQAVHMYTPHNWPRSEHAAPAPTCDRVIPPPPHAAAVPTTTSNHTSLPPPPTHTHMCATHHGMRNTPLVPLVAALPLLLSAPSYLHCVILISPNPLIHIQHILQKQAHASAPPPRPCSPVEAAPVPLQ